MKADLTVYVGGTTSGWNGFDDLINMLESTIENINQYVENAHEKIEELENELNVKDLKIEELEDKLNSQ